MTLTQLHAQLDAIRLTLPIPLEDMRELFALIKGWCPRAVVDVYHANGTRAFVTLDIDNVRTRKIYDGT